MTNFEKIKAMSAEEFAAFVNQIRISCVFERSCCNCSLYDGVDANCGNSLVAWLETEVTE